jgi:Protein of unknown function (DUF3788)
MPPSRKTQDCFSAFGSKDRCPNPEDVAKALGPSAVAAWDELIRRVLQDYPGTTEHWNYASTKLGWSLRLKSADRILLYLTPQPGRFVAGLVLGAKAVEAASHAGLPDAVLAALAAAPRYAEGTGLRLTIADSRDVPAVLELTALKMARGPV